MIYSKKNCDTLCRVNNFFIAEIKYHIIIIICLEVEEYARLKLGIDPVTEPDLIDIARQGLTKQIPHPWKPW